ncbi:MULTISPECIES: alkylmercury lyase [Ornithinimicrobiaceae]|uniref:DF family (seleno)protein n=1 Tax=Ornithinimicrobiaceae TaxID=2805590 RepID=UPI000255E7EC|nr:MULTISPECIES: alkylmercury lyase [Ornithinimicrobiaceae]
MNVQFLYFDGCPHWKPAEARLREALRVHGGVVEVERIAVDTPDIAEFYGFSGSPSVLIDGVDPFAESAAPVALSCRLYRTPEGLAGSPTVEQLVAALSEASAS